MIWIAYALTRQNETICLGVAIPREDAEQFCKDYESQCLWDTIGFVLEQWWLGQNMYEQAFWRHISSQVWKPRVELEEPWNTPIPEETW